MRENSNILKGLVVVVLVLFAIPYFISHHHRHPKAGPLVREVPEIILLDAGVPWKIKDYTLTPLATLNIRARVLHTKRYWLDRESSLSPIDLAVGWRGMSDSQYLDQLNISQSGRWYFFEYKEAPLPDSMISSQSKNIHVIPANPDIASKVKSIRSDQVFQARGLLVRVTGPNGYTWTSALRLEGQGESSCLIFWINEFESEE